MRYVTILFLVALGCGDAEPAPVAATPQPVVEATEEDAAWEFATRSVRKFLDPQFSEVEFPRDEAKTEHKPPIWMIDGTVDLATDLGALRSQPWSVIVHRNERGTWTCFSVELDGKLRYVDPATPIPGVTTDQ